MEDRKIADLLISLEDEIDRKCFKIKEKKREEVKGRLFIFACLLFLFLPFLMHYLGLSIVAVCFPVISFLAVSMISLFSVIMINIEVM